MNRYFKILLTTILALAATPTSPVCPEIEVWGDGLGHYRYLLKDAHIDYIDGHVSLQQQNEFVKMAAQKQAAGCSVSVVVEDMHSFDRTYRLEGTHKKIHDWHYNNQPRTLDMCITMVQKQYGKISSADAHRSSRIYYYTPLIGLFSSCKSRNIYCFNAETKLSIVAYSNQVINRKELLDHLTEYIDTLLPYRSDYPLIQQYFSVCTKDITNMAGITADNEQSFIIAASNLRSHLVDARIMCELIENDTVNHTFIFAGQYHSNNIKHHLITLGYKKMYSVGDANIWDIFPAHFNSLPDDAQQKIYAHVLTHALDLRTAFADIFAQQELIEAQHRATPSAPQLLDLFTSIL